VHEDDIAAYIQRVCVADWLHGTTVRNIDTDRGKASSTSIDHKYLAILSAIIAAIDFFSVLEAATVGCSFDLKAIAPPARQKNRPVTDRRVRRSVACNASS
jgi:hypothetical protein